MPDEMVPDDELPFAKLFAWTFCAVLSLIALCLLAHTAVVVSAAMDWAPKQPMPYHASLMIALFAVLITGVVVFMTFRVDRDAKREASDTARAIAGAAARDLQERGDEVLQRAGKVVDAAKTELSEALTGIPETVNNEVTRRLKEAARR